MPKTTSKLTYRQIFNVLQDDILFSVAKNVLPSPKGLTYSSRYTWKKKLLKKLTNPDFIRAQWSHLSPDAQALWGLLHQLGQISTTERLLQAVLALQAGKIENSETKINDRTFSSLLKELRSSGLALPYRPKWFYSIESLTPYGGVWVIPEEAYNSLAAEGREALRPWRQREIQFRTVFEASFEDWARFLVILWGTTWRKPLRLLKSGGLSKRDKKTFREILQKTHMFPPQSEDSQEHFIEFLVDVLLQAHLLKEDDGVIEAFLDEGYLPKAWLSTQRLHEQIAKTLPLTLLLSYNASSIFYALSSAYGVKAPEHWIQRVFKLLLKQIRDSQQTISLGQIWLWLRETVNQPIPAFTANNFIYPEVLYSGRGELLAAHWLLLVLYILGEADILVMSGAPSEEHIWVGARAALPRAPVKEEGQFVIQPSFQIFCLGPVPLEALALSEVIAERAKFEPMVAEYILERRRFLRALQSGLNGAYTIQRLEELASYALPQNVRRTLQEWVGEIEKVRVFTGGNLVKAEDTHVLDRILKKSTFASRSIRLNDHHALLPPALYDLFELESLKRGIFPVKVASPEEEIVNSVEFVDEVHLRPREKLLGVFLEGTLRRFAVQEEDGIWRFDPEKVRYTVRSMGLERFLNLLKKLTGQEPPQDLQLKIYTWADYLGRVVAQRAILLRFPHEDIMKVVLSIRGLSRWVKPLGNTLALVEEKHWSNARKRLQELGVEIIEKEDQTTQHEGT